MDPNERLQMHASLIREAADLVEEKLSCGPHKTSLMAKVCFLSHLAGVVGGNMAARAAKLIKHSEADAQNYRYC